MADQTVGTFYDGITPGRDTAYIIVNVNVTTAGSYYIVSNTVNGVYFSDSGNFTTAGLNTIKLKPVGAPVSIGSNSYTISFDSSTCYFNLTVQDSTGTGLGHGVTPVVGNTGVLLFSASAGDTTLSTDAAATLVSSGSINDLSITGQTAGGDTTINIVISLTSGTIPSSGQFSASAGNVTLQVTTASGTVYSGINIAGVTLTVNIISYNSSSKQLIGNFAGVVKTTSGRNATLSAGSFNVIVQ